MKLSHVAVFIAVCFSVAFAQQAPQMTPEEIQASINAKPGAGFVYIMDGGFATPSNCQAQMPSEAIFTPLGWVNAQSQIAKKQFLNFSPSVEDTAKFLTVISRGCASGTPSGPRCDSVTRALLLSDKVGTVKVEAAVQRPLGQSWQNGYGATAACDGLLSKFSIADVNKVRGTNGEFMIATFDGATLLKLYTVKQKHLRQLGF